MSEIAPALRQRFEAAAATIQWRPAPGAKGADDWIAHLHDEEARVVRKKPRGGAVLVCDPGPVGALVLLTEIFQRGPPDRLEALDAAPAPFPGGALRAVWGPGRPGPASARPIPLGDLVAAARYALV